MKKPQKTVDQNKTEAKKKEARRCMLKNNRKKPIKQAKKYVQSFNKRPSAEMVYPSAEIWESIRRRYEYVVTEEYFESQSGTSGKDKVKVLSLDCECMILYGRDLKSPKDPKAVWVFLGDGLGKQGSRSSPNYPNIRCLFLIKDPSWYTRP